MVHCHLFHIYLRARGVEAIPLYVLACEKSLYNWKQPLCTYVGKLFKQICIVYKIGSSVLLTLARSLSTTGIRFYARLVTPDCPLACLLAVLLRLWECLPEVHHPCGKMIHPINVYFVVGVH